MVKKIIFILFLVIGILIRVYNLAGLPAGVFADEIALGINAKTLAENGVDEFGNAYPFGFESFADYKLPGYIYATMVSYKIFGATTFAIRLPAALASVFSVFLIGYLARLLFPERKIVPYAAMLVLAFSPFHIHFGRIAYETMLATLFFLVYVICLLHSIRTQRLFWILSGSSFLLLSTWTYHAPRFIIPVFTALLLVYVLVVKPIGIPRKKTLQTLAVFLGVSFISFIPFFFNSEIDKRPLGYIGQNEAGSVIENSWQRVRTTVSSWLRMWNLEFLFAKGDLFGFRHGTGETGMFLRLFLIPLVAGSIQFVKQFSARNFSLVFLLLLFLTSGLPSALTNIFPYGPRVLPVVIPFTLLISLGIDVLWSRLPKRNTLIRSIIPVIVLAIFMYQIIAFIHIYTAHFSHKSLPEFPDAPLSVAKYIKQTRQLHSETPIYFLNGNVCLPWGYDELKLWYYANLNNHDMISWNQQYRRKRFATGNPFGSFEDVPRPVYKIGRLTLHADEGIIHTAQKGSLIIRCGIHMPFINHKRETIKKVFYMYENEKRDPVYVVSEKK